MESMEFQYQYRIATNNIRNCFE